VLLYGRAQFEQQRDLFPGDPVAEVKINAPVTIPCSEHPIAQAHINQNALKVLSRLNEAGFDSYLVGGCVRDLLLGHVPKDFDVVTDAKPEEVRKLFRRARLVGRRFRLAHVRFGREIIEVATFRGMPKPASAGPRQTVEGRILQDNVFGSQEEDAIRRDFTVNALYYDIRKNAVIDYVGGINDLRRGLLHIIGDPEVRYREDPVRLLRVLRFAAKLDFEIEPATAGPIRELGRLLLDVPPARMFEEIIKLFHSGHALKTYELLRHYGLFGYLFPLAQETLELDGDASPRTLVPNALANTDSRVQENKPVTPAFLFAALLWEPLCRQLDTHVARGHTRYEAVQAATTSVLTQQSQRIAIPRRFSAVVREIWVLQSRFNRRTGKQPFRFLEHRRFRAAYDFLLLRIKVGEERSELGDWWTRFQAVEEPERQAMVRKLSAGRKRVRKRQRV